MCLKVIVTHNCDTLKQVLRLIGHPIIRFSLHTFRVPPGHLTASLKEVLSLKGHLIISFCFDIFRHLGASLVFDISIPMQNIVMHNLWHYRSICRNPDSDATISYATVAEWQHSCLPPLRSEFES